MKNKLFMIFFIMLIFLTAYNFSLSEIIYTDLNPDEVINPPAHGGRNYSIDINSDGNYDFGIQVNNMNSGSENVKISGYKRMYQIAGDGDTNHVENFYPIAFSLGEEIGENISFVWFNDWDDTFNHDLPLTICGYGINSPGHWTGGSENKYIAVKMDINGSVHYGWIGIDIPATPNSCTVRDFAFENTPGKAIKAGDKGGSGASETIKINYGSSPIVDGVISFGEWDGAESVQISIDTLTKVKIYIKHDSTSLFIAFLNNLDGLEYRYPEVLLDVSNDKSQNWNTDDWWFHVSYNNCYYQGAHSNYTNCKDVQPDWEANHFSNSQSPNIVEIRIPFSLINFDINNTDTIGIAFDVTNTSTIWNFWPSDVNINSPSTWANAVFIAGTTGQIVREKTNYPKVKIFPNPVINTLYFNYKLDKPDYIKISIYNSIGEQVTSIINGLQGVGEQQAVFHTENYQQGLYYYTIQIGQDVENGKFLLIK